MKPVLQLVVVFFAALATGGLMVNWIGLGRAMSRLSASTYVEFHQATNHTFDPYMPIVVYGRSTVRNSSGSTQARISKDGTVRNWSGSTIERRSTDGSGNTTVRDSSGSVKYRIDKNGTIRNSSCRFFRFHSATEANSQS
jgi:hypothetical protein